MAQDEFWKSGGTLVEDSAGGEWWKTGGTPVDDEKPDRTWGEAIKDTGAQLAEGVNTTIGAIPALVAPDSKAAGFFKDNAEYWRDKQSEPLKQRIAASDEKIRKAGEDGLGAQIGAAASEYWDDPAQAARLVTTNLPSLIPGLGAGKLAQGAAVAKGLSVAQQASVATGTAAAVNAAMNAGGARGEAFDDLQRAHLAQGATPEAAREAALSESLLPAAVGGVAGAVSGKFGLEKSLLGQAGTGSAVRGAMKSAGAELAGEQVEEVAPQIATNLQVGRIDQTRGALDDVGRTMVETTIGAGPGAIAAGGFDAVRNTGTGSAATPAQSAGAQAFTAGQPMAPPADLKSVADKAQWVRGWQDAAAASMTTAPGAAGQGEGAAVTGDVLPEVPGGLAGVQRTFDPRAGGRPPISMMQPEAGGNAIDFEASPEFDRNFKEFPPLKENEPTRALGFNPLAGTPRVYPDGSVALGSDQEFQYRTGAVAPQKRSEQMGLNPSAGPMSAAAATAVDTGAADQVQQQVALTQAAEAAAKAPKGKAPAADPAAEPASPAKRVAHRVTGTLNGQPITTMVMASTTDEAVAAAAKSSPGMVPATAEPVSEAVRKERTAKPATPPATTGETTLEPQATEPVQTGAKEPQAQPAAEGLTDGSPQEAATATTDAPAVAAPAASRAGVPGVNEQGAVSALSNVQDAPQEANNGQAQAARGEARAPEGGNVAAAEGVPAAPGGNDAQAAGVKAAAIAEAAHQAATSPKNDLPQPSEAQKEAGNYQKGHARVAGHDITIENPAGSKRRPEWPALKNHYGYFKGSVGADKDHVDVFMTDRADDSSLPVFVVDQTNRDGTFDEHKIVMGTADEAEARATYLQNYEKGWTGLGAITQMSQDEFKAWVRDPAKTKKPVALKRGVLAKMADQKAKAARRKSEDIRDSRWESLNLSERERVAEAIGRKGIFAQKLAEKRWDRIDPEVKAKLRDVLDAQRPAQSQPEPEADKAPPAEPVKPEPAPQPKVEKPASKSEFKVDRAFLPFPADEELAAGARYIIGSNGAGERIEYPGAASDGAQADDAFMGTKKDEPRNLVAMHNLTAENLLYADSMGGIPVPSIGITKIDTPFGGFGDVTLIAPSSMVDPEHGTPVFDRDAWTARFPTMNFKKVKAKVADAFYERMKSARQMGDDGDSFTSLLWEQLRNASVQSPDKVADLFRRYNAAKLFYAKEVLGKDIKAPMKAAPLSSPAANDKQLQAYWKKNGQRLVEIDRELSGFEFSNSPEYKAFIAEVEGAVRRYAESTGRPERADSYVSMFLPDGSLGPGGFRNLKDDFDKVGEKVVDGIKFNELIRKAVPDNDTAYQRWVNSLVEPLFEAPTITVRGREVAPTLDNIVESMTIGATQGAEKSLTFGPGKTAAMLGKRFKSMAEIKAARDQVVSQAVEADGKKATETILDEYRTRVASSYKYTDWRGNIDTWAANDAAMEALAKAGKAGGSSADIRQALVRAGFKLADQTTIDLASQSIKALRNAATDYFEAKPQRAVKLNEFRGAVIPKGSSQEVKDTLTKNGIEFIEFNKSADGARDAAIQKMAKRVDKAAKDILFAGSKDKQAQGTPEDRAVMAMAGDGKSADEILRFIANASKSTFNRQIAHLLRRTGANPAVSLGGDMGGGAGFRFLAKYSRKNHEVTLSEGAADRAEQILLHEMVHAATLLALDRGGEHADRMKALYESVKKQGLSDAYGMKNVGEFVAEAFTNKEFQKALKGYKAPGGTAWDRFVAAVRRILGMSDRSQDALSAALEMGVDVMRENVPLRAAKSFRAEDAPALFEEAAGRQLPGTSLQSNPEADGILDANFGVADAVEQISPQAAVKPVVQFLNDTFKVRGKLHWWHKTVGTPFNLAERVPEFKRVFNAVQDFITSVSFYGAEAAAMAPKIIPKLESWKDLGKSPISAADNKAIASPIFEGTLSWRRDSTGKPVLADSVEEAGIVWTDDELRSKFLLTDEQVGLYREFRAATDKSLTGLALSDMLQFAGDDAKPIRDVVMGMSLKEGSETLSKYLKSLAAGEEKTRKGILLDTANTVMDRADKAQSLIDRGYAPLQRFGRHTIYAKNDKGEQLFFGMYEDRWAAGRAARQMREQYPDATVEVGMMSEQSYKMFQGISPETLELFGTMLGMDANADGESNKAFQMYLKLAKSNRSALKRLIERKGVSGYSEDASRVLASFIYSNARQTSTNLHVGDIMNSVNDIPRDMGDAKDAAMKLARYTMDPQEEAQALRGLLFAQYLGGSIASAAINALQPAQVTFPYLSQFVGAKRSAVLMGGAVKDALKKSTGDAKLDAELRKAEEEGIVSPQEIFQLMAQAQGKATLKAGDGTTAGDAAATASNTLARLSLGWGKVFSIPEQFNRRTTFIAAYRTALETGEANPYDFAKQAVKETQLVYNKGNRPEWARGTVGALAFTFKTYSISYVELLQRMSANGPEGRRAAMLMIATLMLMAGAGGLPGIEDAENVVDGIAQRVFGLNFQSRQKRQEWLAEVFGEGGARFIENGLSGLPWSPTDVSGRLGLGNLIPGTGVFVKKQDYSRDIAEIAGPAADMTKRFLQGAGLLLQGEVLKAGEIVAPAAVRNMIQGARMGATDQYADTKGRKVIDTTPAEALTKFIGFQPADIARVQESTGTIQQMIALNKIRESEIADKWAKGLASKDQEQIQEARDELLKWNRANPGSPIRINMSQIFKRVKALNEDKATRIARTAPKEIRQDVRRELESNQ